MNEFPADIPVEELGVSWCPAGAVPSELIEGENPGAQERAAWASMLRELSFFATESEGGWLAL
jgi:hypothetical protein